MALSNASFSVIYGNEELVVVSKPHDVPMDGEEHVVTVEKWAHAYRAKSDCANSAAGGDADRDERAAGTAGTYTGRRNLVKFVHQLDYATSGVLCIAFSKEMAARLAHCFEMRTVQKAYLAVLCGMIPPLRIAQNNRDTDAGVDFLIGSRYSSRVRMVLVDDVPNAHFVRKCIMGASGHVEEEDAGDCAALLRVDLPVGYDTTDPRGFRMAVNGRDERESVTYVHVLQRGYMMHPTLACPVPVTKVVLFPRTGRRHQLRVHCHAIGFPILGDVTYASIPTPRVAPEAQGAETMTNVGATASANVADEVKAADAWQRMMLHAWRLSFPVSVEPLRCGMERYMQKRRRRRETLGLAVASGDDAAEWTHFETKDPFQSISRQ
ncbi:pseudouridylate synthase [Trypanosoma rangeli]|uniref:Pseudouridylate synthase n=1 Tax=Trypanosoma rangeli TaxID=5698 RepID=A0A3R7P3S4_TRYRA|nr:pseudouridylate synthase [Trypanosoma rangeli]RNF12296.1 pseudouridylate synthase [Trypanosoma rangeli]|eukprot:RNF12296.1 pseudouridylate synthase [Trypanosoma rangeli]